jgi:cytidylate kinase
MIFCSRFVDFFDKQNRIMQLMAILSFSLCASKIRLSQNMKKLIIAIDGYSGCGKSTTAKGVAKALGYRYIDTGAMYRSITLAAINNNLDAGDEKSIIALLPDIHIDFEYNAQKGQNSIFLNGEDISDRIRHLDVNQRVSEIAAIKEVRDFLVKQQRKMGEKGGLVMDGRDIGTTVFPNADLKVFMMADLDVRAKRRVLELEEKGQEVSHKEIADNLSQRDQIDTSRAESPLTQAEDATVLDTTHMRIEDQVAQVIDWAKVKEQP